MPKVAVDYSNTIIYKIQHEDNEELLYVGHTTNFTKRKCSHKHTCNNPTSKAYNIKLYQMIRCNGGWSAFNMVEMKKFPCNNANEASAEEDRIMREMKATMNDRRASRTKHQYTIDNKNKKREYDIEYRKKNRDKIIEFRERNSQKMTCDCGAVILKGNLGRHFDTGKHFRYIQNNNIE